MSGDVDTGAEFEAVAVRVTELVGGGFGRARVWGRGTSVRLNPVIEPGREYRFPEEGPPFMITRDPDRFRYWELQLVDTRSWWRKILVRRRVRGRVALEFWTDDTPNWVHWLFPHVTLDRHGAGRTHTGAPLTVGDFPDKETPLTEGGFWKTTVPPPQGAVT